MINDKLHGSVACGFVNNCIKKVSLLNLPVIFFQIGEYLTKLQARRWLSRARCAPMASILLKVEEKA